MTMQGTDLTGARVTDSSGKVVGKVDKVFNDDLDGKPVWALIRAGKASRFIPVRGSRMTADGFSVPFDAQKIMSGPDLGRPTSTCRRIRWRSCAVTTVA